MIQFYLHVYLHQSLFMLPVGGTERPQLRSLKLLLLAHDNQL